MIKRNLIRIGYSHASLIGIHRPDIAYPNRKVKKGTRSVGVILSEPCDCADGHVEVFVRQV